MDREFWLVCMECGYSVRVYSEAEVYEKERCSLCGSIMILDLHKGKKIEPEGDNFPSFIKNGICEKDNMTMCNLGFACDGCPYNKDNFKNISKVVPVNDFMNLQEKLDLSKLPKITEEEIIDYKMDLIQLKGIDDLLKQWEKK